ncbi:TPA: hypothetical protein GDO54_018665 [Pyxicephalus adspersus]|uniref:Uncharacterized protein n=1 Tax=Pyxicephalus adspersus TaxID=30357 RepID=A0AAV2ZDD7_PYXAD|nr:TPA: hypothetical protein GDO54_018665 [Pyxicephalus adspersus]
MEIHSKFECWGAGEGGGVKTLTISICSCHIIGNLQTNTNTLHLKLKQNMGADSVPVKVQAKGLFILMQTALYGHVTLFIKSQLSRRFDVISLCIQT